MASFFQAEESLQYCPVMRLWPAHQPHPSSCLCLLLLAGLTFCQAIPTRPYEIRQRAVTYQPSVLVRDYQEEYAYIQGWRDAVVSGQASGVSNRPTVATAVPTNLTKLAFFGRGIGSDTFHLGILQALYDMQP